MCPLNSRQPIFQRRLLGQVKRTQLSPACRSAVACKKYLLEPHAPENPTVFTQYSCAGTGILTLLRQLYGMYGSPDGVCCLGAAYPTRLSVIRFLFSPRACELPCCHAVGHHTPHTTHLSVICFYWGGPGVRKLLAIAKLDMHVQGPGSHVAGLSRGSYPSFSFTFSWSRQ